MSGLYQKIEFKINHKKESLVMKNLEKHLLFTFLISAFALLFFSIGFAQPPGLPSDPSQAPIDGGLGLLAAAGGTYAWKKLRNKTQ